MKYYWISCKKFTVNVGVDRDGIIRDPAPIVKRFRGQPFSNLKRWAEKFGELIITELDPL